MTAASPYPGLRAFRRDESDVFFGREEHVDDLLEKLDQTRFLAVVGPSGCGKSSLVRAGMIPALETGFMVGAGARWRIAEMRPGSHPMKRLAQALLGAPALGHELRGADRDADAFLLAELRRGPLGLVEILRDSPLPPETNLLLLVDQFEEIFRFSEDPKGPGEIKSKLDEADAFVSVLLDTAAQRQVSVYIVITMRTDYLDRCAFFAGLPEAINAGQYLTPRLNREQISAAIVGPARVFGGDIEPALVNQLLNDMGRDPDQLPLMQHVLMRMCSRVCQPPTKPPESDGSTGPPLPDVYQLTASLTLGDYEAVGGLSDALSNHADEAYEELSPEQQHVAEILFRCLSDRSLDRRPVRRPFEVEKIALVANTSPKGVIRVAEAFRDPARSFITPASNEPLYPNTVLDIGHESLIRQWRRLKEWVETEARSGETYRRLEQTALLWQENKAGLWGTPDLDIAIDWQEREQPNQPWAVRYGSFFELAMEFLGESQQKRAHDEAAAREAERRELKRAQRTALFALVGLLVAIGLAGWALLERTDAQALSNAAKALNEVDHNPELSVILARGAVTASNYTSVKPEAENALHRALHAFGQRHTLRGHNGPVYAVAFNHARGLIATASEDQSVRLWDATTYAPRYTLSGHGGPVYAISLNPKGPHLATAGKDRNVRIWDTRSGQLKSTLTGHQAPVYVATYTRDGHYIGTADAQGTVRVWDATNNYVLVSTLIGHEAMVFSVIFSSDTRYIATASQDKTARLWDLTDGKMRYKFEHTPDREPTVITSIAFSPDSRWLATAGWDKEVKIWNTATGHLKKKLSRYDKIVNIVAFHPNGEHLLTGGDEGTVRIWDFNEGKLVRRFGGMGVIKKLVLAANGKRVAASDKSSVKIWDFSTGAELRLLPRSETPTTSIAFTPNGAWLAITSRQGTVNLWNSTPGEQLCTFVGLRPALVTRVAFNHDATRLAVAYDNGTSQVIEPRGTCPMLYSLKHGDKRGEATITHIVFSPNGRMLATAGIDKTVKIWDAGRKPKTETPLATLAHRSGVASVAFSPDSKRVVSVTSDGSLMMWESEMKNHFVQIWSHHTKLNASIPALPELPRQRPQVQRVSPTIFSVSRTFDMTFSKDGSELNLIDPSGNPSAWDVGTGERRQIINSPSARPDASATLSRAVAISSQGMLVATVSANEAKLRDLTKLRETTIRHEKDINDLAFSPDGKRLATASDDRQTIVSDVVTGDKVFALPGQSGRVRTVAFSPNGKWIATVEADNNIRIYAADIEELKNLSLRRAPHDLTTKE